jgi:hypothetical protein
MNRLRTEIYVHKLCLNEYRHKLMFHPPFNTVSCAAIFGKGILTLTACHIVKILTNQRVKRSILERSSAVCVFHRLHLWGTRHTSVSMAALLSYSDFLHHMEDLKPGERTRRVEVVTPCPVHARNQLAHVSRKVVFRRHFSSHADTGVPEKIKSTLISDDVSIKINTGLADR